MEKTLRNLKWEQALPRVIADFALVHFSMIGALVASVLYQAARGDAGRIHDLTDSFMHYYIAFFWLLSPIFPLVFLCNGFYTHSRGYRGRYKICVIIRGVAIAVMIFFTAHMLLFGSTFIGRSMALPFMLLAVLSLSGSRIVKAVLEERYDVRRKASLTQAPQGTRRVLVVGGAGYIGSLLVERLLEKGYEVRVLDSLLYGDEPLRSMLSNPRLDLVVGDCRNIQDVVRAVKGVELVVHLAAIVGDPACDLDHQTALEINYAATRMLIEVAKGNGVKRFVFASSCSVYGSTDEEMDENSPVQPVSLYGDTKVDSERALLAAADAAFHPTILRYATVFGLGHRPRFDLVVNLLTAKAHQNSGITIFNGEQWRPFIHVRDVVEATIQTLEAPVRLVSREIFNVGDSKLNHTLTEVGEVIQAIFPDVAVERADNLDRRDYRVSFKKLRDRLGFQATFTLRDGILELKNALDQGLIADYLDLRYNNQRFLKMTGGPVHKDEFDSTLMAAIAAARPKSHEKMATGPVLALRSTVQI